MFKQLFDGLLRRSPASLLAPAELSANGQTDKSPKHPQSPTDSSALELPPNLGLVSCQPIFDKQRSIVAYNFLVRQSQRNIAAGKQAEFDGVLLNSLQNMGVFRLLAYRRAFVHISILSLSLPILPVLPVEGIIFVLSPSLNQPVGEALIQQLQQLRKLGLRFAIAPALYDEKVLPPALQAAWFGEMDYLLFDFQAPAARVLIPITAQLPKHYPNVRWLACNIATVEDQDLCFRGPMHTNFSLFHGPLANVSQGAQADVAYTRVAQIMRLLRSNAPTAEIEQQIKLDSVLLFKLLRFVNSPLHGLARKVQTIEDTLQLLGRDTLFKWLAMLLFTSRKDQVALALLEKSLIRAHLLEKMGAYRGNKADAEQLFLLGMFSLLDSLLGVPLAEALKPLQLATELNQALLTQQGPLALYLEVVLACETMQQEQLAVLAEALHFDLELINQYYLDSVVWAQEVLQVSEINSHAAAV